MPDNEDAAAPLGDSEVSSVQYPPGEAVPEVGQRAENDGKVSSVGSGEKPRDVLEQEPSGPNREVCDPVAPVEEQAGPGTLDAGSFPGDGPVLTGDSPADKIDATTVPPWFCAKPPVVSSDRAARAGNATFALPPPVIAVECSPWTV